LFLVSGQQFVLKYVITTWLLAAASNTDPVGYTIAKVAVSC